MYLTTTQSKLIPPNDNYLLLLPDQLLMSRTPGLNHALVLDRPTDNPRLKIDNLLHHLACGVARLTDFKHRQRLRDCEKKKVVGEETTRADAPAEAIGDLARIRFGGFLGEARWVECFWVGVDGWIMLKRPINY